MKIAIKYLLENINVEHRVFILENRYGYVVEINKEDVVKVRNVLGKLYKNIDVEYNEDKVVLNIY